ncbi:transporter [Leifsonia xyli subsp. xyli]|uniref:Transport integral membrane protein n=2 Tax=Leifsonia xyli subsp. xyli TaxID=59736 RepID=Q6AC85_LEIXX|nr:copper resistance CopC family protein [Leifsonia xyli]AAT90008.1 transport integral membrane protein [Leifsonia xyli subsp. xyli str. CTCB07]ODA90014.1 transporter [Leifsonia xyli subsp. xyli]
MTARRVCAAAGVVAAVAIALAPAATASAHDYLVESSPAAGSVQAQALPDVSLTFNDRVLDLTGDGSSALVQVTDAAGRHFETGCSSILDRTVTVPVALGGAGTYTVEWQIVSADGHTVSSSIQFRFQAPAGFAAAAGSAERPACGVGAIAASSSPAPLAGQQGPGRPGSERREAEPPGDSTAVVVGVAVGTLALAAAGVAIVLLTARRRQTVAPDDDAGDSA